MAPSKIAPVHPGAYIKELVEELGLTQEHLAQEIGISPTRISHLINGKRPLTAEVALRLGRYFGQNPRYWLNLQSRYDMDFAEDDLGAQVRREVRPFRSAM